jgi:hypothetical protein
MECAIASIGKCNSTPALIAAHPAQKNAARSPTIDMFPAVVAIWLD